MYLIESSSSQSDDPIVFLRNRKAGASETAKNAKTKGGDAILSYYHFAAKDKPYSEVIKLLRTEGLQNAIKFCKVQYKVLIKSVDINMNQKEYQAILGKIEVFGECYIKLNNLD